MLNRLRWRSGCPASGRWIESAAHTPFRHETHALGFALPPGSRFRTLPHDMFHNHNTYYSPGRLAELASSFEFMHGLGRGYAAIHPFLTPDQDRVYREGVLQVADKEMGFISYQSNQMMHVLEGDFHPAPFRQYALVAEAAPANFGAMTLVDD